MPKVTLMYFGVVAEAAQRTKEILEIEPNLDLKTVHSSIVHEIPGLKKLNYRIALDKQLVDLDTKINDDCEIALLPPFAGG